MGWNDTLHRYWKYGQVLCGADYSGPDFKKFEASSRPFGSVRVDLEEPDSGSG